METKTITIKIPVDLDETDFKEWCMVRIERYIRAIKQAEVPSIEDLVKPEIDDIRNKNGIKVAEEIPTEEIK